MSKFAHTTDETSTYHSRTAQYIDDVRGGRFGYLGKESPNYISGTKPTSDVPALPSTHNWAAADNAVEPTIDVSSECGLTFDGRLTRGHPDLDNQALLTTQPSLVAPTAVGEAVARRVPPPPQPKLKRRL